MFRHSTVGRGLGPRQREFLAAAQRIEAKYNAEGANLYLAAIIREMWTEDMAQLAQKADSERQAQEAADLAAWKASDADARLDFLASVIRGFRRRSYGGSPKLRPAHAKRTLNPSRIVSELERRGLVERMGRERGHGVGGVRLTEAGRRKCCSDA